MLVSVYTLGCKLNQLETEAIADSFRGEGFTLVPWNFVPRNSAEPIILVINTCTVTSMADQKARRIIRKALREYPGACLIITGCYAQMEKTALAALEGESTGETDLPANAARRLFVVSGEQKDRILDLSRFLAGADAGSFLPRLVASWLASSGVSTEDEGGARQNQPGREAAGVPARSGSFRFKPERFSSHSRGFLKIQDGCDCRCTFCRVSLARGKSRSLGTEEVLRELISLENRGFAEAVLTGVNIFQYRDAGGKMGLPGLLDFLLKRTERIRLRLSSIEPDGLTDEFFTVAANPRVRPHFHFSLQSGSPEILLKMGRRYSPADIEKAAARFRSVRDDPFLAADIIAGFPGETEADFEETLSLCGRIGFAWIHAFPFSPRPGTAASAFPGRVSEREAARRVESLTLLARKGRREYLNRWEGKEVEAVVEAGKGIRRGHVPGVSENYLKLLVACGGEAPPPGALIRCRILRNGVPDSAETAGNIPAKIDAMAERID